VKVGRFDRHSFWRAAVYAEASMAQLSSVVRPSFCHWCILAKRCEI